MEDKSFPTDEAETSDDSKHPRKGESFITEWLLKKGQQRGVEDSVPQTEIPEEKEGFLALESEPDDEVASEEVTINLHTTPEAAALGQPEGMYYEQEMKENIQQFRERTDLADSASSEVESAAPAATEQLEVVKRQQEQFEDKLDELLETNPDIEAPKPVELDFERSHEVKDEPGVSSLYQGASSIGSILQQNSSQTYNRATELSTGTTSSTSMLKQNISRLLQNQTNQHFIRRGFVWGVVCIVMFTLGALIF